MRNLGNYLWLMSLEMKDKAKWYHYWIYNIIEVISYRPAWWYDTKCFLQNLSLFLRLAWKWRAWDYQHTVETLCELLKQQAKYIEKSGTSVGSKRVARRAYTAAGLLDRAYSGDVDTSLLYLLDIMYTERLNTSSKYLDNREFYNRLYETVNKRCKEEETRAKREAWEYLNKYIEHFWD